MGGVGGDHDRHRVVGEGLPELAGGGLTACGELLEQRRPGRVDPLVRVVGDAALDEGVGQPGALGSDERDRRRRVGGHRRVEGQHPQRAPHGVMADQRPLLVEGVVDRRDRTGAHPLGSTEIDRHRIAGVQADDASADLQHVVTALLRDQSMAAGEARPAGVIGEEGWLGHECRGYELSSTVS